MWARICCCMFISCSYIISCPNLHVCSKPVSVYMIILIRDITEGLITGTFHTFVCLIMQPKCLASANDRWCHTRQNVIVEDIPVKETATWPQDRYACDASSMLTTVNLPTPPHLHPSPHTLMLCVSLAYEPYLSLSRKYVCRVVMSLHIRKCHFGKKIIDFGAIRVRRVQICLIINHIMLIIFGL